MIPVIAPPCYNSSIYEGKKIEYIVSDEKFRNNFWVNIAPINSVSKVNKINFTQIKSYVKEFFSQLECKRDHFQNISVSSLLRHFIQASGEILAFAPNKIAVELTSSKSIFIFGVKEGTNIYLEMFFDETSGKFSEAVVNIYENKAQKLAVNGSISKVISEIDEHFKPVSINYFNYLEESYAVSGSITPSTTF
jgi:hypothetical protein